MLWWWFGDLEGMRFGIEDEVIETDDIGFRKGQIEVL
jgi:hypothetical protein